MNDLISRRQAVDAICKEWCCCSHDDCKYKNMMENGFDPCDGCSDVDAIMELPSAQPERKIGTSDLISRRAVELALIEKGQASKRYKVGEFWELNGEEIREALASVPSAQPEWKKGTWTPAFNGKFTGGAYWFNCSECGRIVPEVRNGGWNFCPHCGADMRGEQDDQRKSN